MPNLGTNVKDHTFNTVAENLWDGSLCGRLSKIPDYRDHNPMKDQTSSPFSTLLIEGRTSNPGEFQKVLPATSEQDHHQVMFKLLQTLSNFHDTVADMYASKGDNGKASYHYQIANRIRAEASAARRTAS